MKVSIIIPTLNENENIIPLIREIEELRLPDYEVIVVDENSTDDTFKTVSGYSAKNKNVHAILNDGERGLSPSVMKGFSAAGGDILCCMDGDCQHDPKDLLKLLETVKDCDMALGSRYASNGGIPEEWPMHRRAASKTAVFLSQLILGVGTKDPMSGFFAVRKNAFERERKFLDPHGFKIMLEVYVALTSSAHKYAIRETGITFRCRNAGKSKLNYRVTLQLLFQLASLYKRKKSRRAEGLQ